MNFTTSLSSTKFLWVISLINAFMFMSSGHIMSQTCTLPFLSSFEAPSIEGFIMYWEDNNPSVESYEIEFGIKGFQRDFKADIDGIELKQHEFNGLQSGNTYEVYLRSICSVSDTSDWNGPYFFNTVIDNENSCDIDLDITDNKCPTKDLYKIFVNSYPGMRLNEQFLLSQLEISIQHPWPADLHLELISPTGKVCRLSSFNGNGIDNYGNPESNNCTEFAAFDDRSCNSISNSQAPFISRYKPEENMNSTFNGELINGIWNLAICDNSPMDLGKLKYVHLAFEDVECPNVREFVIENIESTKANLKWKKVNGCERIRLEYIEPGAPITEGFLDYVECHREIFEINELKANTEYQLLVYSECADEKESSALCEILFRTRQYDSKYLDDLDNLEICEASCITDCFISDIWSNTLEDDNNDWLVFDRDTPSMYTGPDSDHNSCGKFIYTESSLSCSFPLSTSILQSQCLEYDQSNPAILSFYYHMYKSLSSRLSVEISRNESDWQEIWYIEGDQGDQWIYESIDIELSNEQFRLRFVAESSDDGIKSDIALDHIKLIGIDTISPSLLYEDLDGDSFGNILSSKLFCSSMVPSNYSINSLDCNDNNASINPDALEIVCNGIDDNCNGPDDELDANKLNYAIDNITHSSCEGISNGSIELEINSTSQDITYLWSNGEDTQDIFNLGPGIYTCTISNAEGCSLITEDFIIESDIQLDILSIEMMETSCPGAFNGTISMEISNGVMPYEAIWSNGDEGLSITGIRNGSYSVTVSDANGCLISQELELLSEQSITTGIISLSHESCKGSADGSIRVGAFGGSPPYTYMWNNNMNDPVINRLQPGLYSVTIIDSNDCEASIEGIEVLPALELSADIVSIDHIDCFGDRSSKIDIQVTGGIEPYSFVWSNGSFNEDLVNQKAGFYSVSITDSKACSTSIQNIELKQNPKLSIKLDSVNDLRCTGSTNGYLEVSVSGGQAPYNFFWSTEDGTASNSNSIDQLLAGRYALTVTDQNQCKAQTQNLELLNLNESINVSLLPLDSISCHNESDASLIAVVNNGVLPLDYNWSAGRQVLRNMYSDTILSLGSSKYNLTITDSEGCVGISDSIEVLNPQELEFELVNIQDNSCHDSNDARIELIIIGGTSPREVIWNSGDSGSIVTGLSDGPYMATISDSRDCMIETSTYLIDSPDPLDLDIEVIDSDNSNNGMITVHPSGGTGPYFFNWASAGQGEFIDSIAQHLAPGDYQLSVFDSNSCLIDTIINVKLISSIADVALNKKLRIYPNPNHGILRYNMPLEWNLRAIEILDSNSKKISKINKPTDEPLELTAIKSNGLYFIRFEFKEFVIIKKLIILQ